MKLKGLLCIILLILQSGAFGTEHCEVNKVLSVTASKPEGLKNFTSFPFENDFYFVGEREREGAINFKVSLSVQRPDLTLKAPETNPVTKSTNGGVITEYEVVKTAGGEKKISGKVYLVVLSAEIYETFKVDDDVVIGVSKGESENPKTKLMAEAVGADDWTATIKLIPDDKSVEILAPTELSKSSNLTNIRITKGYEFEKKEPKKLELTFKIKGKEVKVVKNLDLLPVNLRDVNGEGEEDDVTIIPWDTSQNITNENISWIDAHAEPGENANPRMPQLEFRVPGLPDGLTIEAKLNVQYTRGNGSRAARNQAEDRVRIPANGNLAQVNGDSWQLYNEADWQTELTERGFFGGEATLTYQIKKGTDILVGPEEIDFRIGGENPDDARCRTYIESRPNAGPGGNLWFAYAIAKSESRSYNDHGQNINTRYNQFLELPRHRIDVGKPLWGNDGGTRPGGYGMFQVTVENDLPRRQIWDWRENITGGLQILAGKRTIADDWMNRQRNAQNANGTALPDHTVRGVTFSEGTNRTMNDAVTIKLYNGASRPPAGTDNGNVPEFLLHNGSGHYSFWRNASNRWALNRFNNPPAPIQPFNYVDRVCQEIED